MATGRLGVVTQAIVTGMAVDERSGRVRGVTYLKGCGPFQDPLLSERAPPGRWYAYLAGPYYMLSTSSYA